MTAPLRFRPQQRLRSPSDFERVYNQKQRASDSRILMYMARNHVPWSRVGFSISRKHGNSVVRHRLRRLLREAFRLSQHDIPAGWDLILIPKQGSQAKLEELQESLVSLTRRLAKRSETT